MEQADVVVIGAGVVGLAIARQFALAGRDVVVLESEAVIGSGVSSRSSEVVHAGLYYSQGSLKARLCVAGKVLLRDYCLEHGVGYRQCGKLIVAENAAQMKLLAGIKTQSELNGVFDMEVLSAAQVHALEPELACAGALLSPSTGIVDAHGLMLALQGDLEAHGGVIAFHAAVTHGRVGNGRIVVGTADLELEANLVINSAGLGAQGVAQTILGLDSKFVAPLHLAKGNYFALSGRSPFDRLVYPIPEPGGLGVHFTLDLAGIGRFGPDVEWIDTPHYDVDPKLVDKFHDRIARYWPGVRKERLHPAYAGIRPKIERPGGSGTDFIIQGPAQHGVAGLINLFGIESPGLTSCLAIAQYVAAISAAARWSP